jgi:hypothetical protein
VGGTDVVSDPASPFVVGPASVATVGVPAVLPDEVTADGGAPCPPQATSAASIIATTRRAIGRA